MCRVPGCKITISVGIFSMPSLHHTTGFYKDYFVKILTEGKRSPTTPLMTAGGGTPKHGRRYREARLGVPAPVSGGIPQSAP